MTKKFTKETGIKFPLFPYKYDAEYDTLKREVKDNESGYSIAKGQASKIAKIDFGFKLLDGELPIYQLDWEKRTNYKKGNTGTFISIQGTKKQIIDQIKEYPIFIRDGEAVEYLNRLFMEYEDRMPTISKRYIITKPFKAHNNPKEYQEFLEWTKEWTETMQYTFGTYFIVYHFFQYFLRNKWTHIDRIKAPFLIGDEGGWKTPLSVMIMLPDHPEQDTFDGNLSRTIGERPNTWPSFRDSLSKANRGVTMDESGDILLANNGTSRKLNKQFENLLLQLGKSELPSKKKRDGDQTLRQSWTGFPMFIFNDDVEFKKAVQKRVEKIEFTETYNYDGKWLEADWLTSNLQALLYAVASEIFNYDGHEFDINKIKKEVWNNLNAPWLAEAENNTVEDPDDIMQNYLNDFRGYMKYYHVDITDEQSIRQEFMEKGILRIGDDGSEYLIQGMRGNNGIIPYFKRAIRDNSIKRQEAWEIIKKIFKISEDDYVDRPECKGEPARPRGAYMIGEDAFDNIIVEDI